MRFGNVGKMVVTCVVALVCGFAGATVAFTAFHSQLVGTQGPTGLTGAVGPAGADGVDGVDGADGLDGKDGARGVRGPRGASGKSADTIPAAVDLGNSDCAGRSVSVITGATITADQQLKLTRATVCIVSAKSNTTTPVATP